MGGSKALLLVRDRTLAALHAERMREAGCDWVVLVVRPHVVPKLEALAVRGSTFDHVYASVADDQAGSLAVALAAGDVADDAAVLITPVDAAPAARTTLEHLVAALAPDVDAATPRHGGKSGILSLAGRGCSPHIRAQP